MRKKVSTEDFIAKAKSVHGNTYTYENVKYLKSSEKVTITCLKHGSFEQKPNHHLSGRGCTACSKEQKSKLLRKDTSIFCEEANLIHNGAYDYSKVNYTTNKTKVEIICLSCNNSFMQRPSSHLKGEGCPSCVKTKPMKDTDSFILECKNKHGDSYCYSNTLYTGMHENIEVICNQCNLQFVQKAYSHRDGHGCPSCSKSGFDPTKPAILYYIKVADEFYKIGITNLTVQERFQASDLLKINVLSITDYEIGERAYKEEQRILSKYKKYQYIGIPLLSSGNTEIFTKDVLALEG